MSEGNSSNFLYLNGDGLWPGFDWAGIERGDDGALRLAALPRLAGELPDVVKELAAPDAPAGAAAAPDGTVYWTDPDASRLFVREFCDGAVHSACCVGGAGDDPTQFRTPRGLVVLPARNALIVADSGNHRLQLFALDSLHLIGIWGEYGVEPGRFDEPWSLAADGAGNVYVVDYGNHRVQKFDSHGHVISEFSDNAQTIAGVAQPREIAVAPERAEVYVLGSNPARIVVLDTDGTFKRQFVLEDMTAPVGLLAHEQSIYVGDNDRRRLVRMTPDGDVIGESYGYEGPVAAVTVDHHDRIWLAPGDGNPPLPLLVRGAYVKHGVLWGGPFTSGPAVAWHRLKALGAPRDGGAHFRFYVRTSDEDDWSPAAQPMPGPDTFDEDEWRDLDERPDDVPDVLVGGTPKRYLWVAAHFSGDGLQSPRVDQIRIDYDHETYGKHLPAIYYTKSPNQDIAPQPELLDRFLSLFESFFVDIEGRIERLARYFDPQAVPSAWLSWLASWFGLELDEDLPEVQKRQAIAMVFEASAHRGTAEGLRRALRFYAGVDARIEEPLLATGWWALPPAEGGEGPSVERSILGLTTVLVSVEAQGAVLGTSAVLDGSRLIEQEDFGAPLFEETAHQFSVSLYRSQVCDSSKLDEVRAIIDREKPAHTHYELCLIEPLLSVGFQARVGIDTVVPGCPPSPSGLGERHTVLAGEPAGRIDRHSRLGRTTRLGTGAIEATE
ncbi:MAG: phage tail protein [Phycisphaerales bacterium]